MLEREETIEYAYDLEVWEEGKGVVEYTFPVFVFPSTNYKVMDCFKYVY